jgi:hypothetical protein
MAAAAASISGHNHGAGEIFSTSTERIPVHFGGPVQPRYGIGVDRHRGVRRHLPTVSTQNRFEDSTAVGGCVAFWKMMRCGPASAVQLRVIATYNCWRVSRSEPTT